MISVTPTINKALNGNDSTFKRVGETIWNWVSTLGTIASFLGFGLLSVIILVIKNRKEICSFFTQRKLKLLKRGYFSDSFLSDNIRKSRERITIFSVRNMRVTEPDILQEFRQACSRSVNVELYWMSPDVDDIIIDEIMGTLPTPPGSVADYRTQVEHNKQILCQERTRWSEEQRSRLRVYTYKTLPTMHFCRFDNKLFLGFQIFDNNDDLRDQHLGDYAIVIKTESALGKLILNQLDLLNQDRKISQIV